MSASTIAVFKNWWILAGSNVTVPTYFNIGNISVIGDNQVDIISNGNAALVAGNTALIASGSNITIYCSTLTDIQSPRIDLTATNETRITSPTISVFGAINTNGNPLLLRDQYHGICWGNTVPYNVGVDGPFVFGYSGGALGTRTSGGNNLSLVWNDNSVNIYKHLYMNTCNIYNVSRIENASGDFAINATNTYLNNSGFVQFNCDHIGMYRGYLDMNANTINSVGRIYFANGAGFNADIPSGNSDIYGKGLGYYFSFINGGSYFSIRPSGEVFINSDTQDINLQAHSNIGLRTPSGQYITLEQQGTGNQSYIQIRPGGEIVQYARNYFEFIANGGSNNIYMTAAYTEFRGNVGFNDSNRSINNLGHIYGGTSAPGGGLAIDYMYGMFFNSAGHNANLFADAGGLHMINYNTGIDIANYNPNGTGNVSIYSASNDVHIGTGTGRNININANAVNIITGNLDMYGHSIINVHDIGAYGNMSIHADNTMTIASGVGDLNLTATGYSVNISGNGINMNTSVAMNAHPITGVANVYGTGSGDIILNTYGYDVNVNGGSLNMNNKNIINCSNLQVNTVNGYHTPWISTLNTAISSFTFDGTITTPQATGLSITFPYPGIYELSRKVAFTKVTGGIAQDCHGFLIIDGAGAITFPAGESGLAALPYTNDNGASTFTTIFTTVEATAGNLTKQIYYQDYTNNNYTVSLVVDKPVLRYIPPPNP